MKIALLKGNRFNPWHLQVFQRLRGAPEIVAFRAESEIQQHFHDRDDGSLSFAFERIYFDTQKGNPITRLVRIFQERYRNRPPGILPFHEKLKGFDIIQTWETFTEWSEQAVIAKKKYGIPLSVMVWDNIPFNMERNPHRRETKKLVTDNADVFIVHTERSRRMLDMEGIPADKVIKILPGADIEVFSPGKANRESFGICEDEFVVLFVGWMLPRKGIDFLLLALRELHKDPDLKDKKFKLMIVGSGPGKQRVEKLAERLGVSNLCKFTGSIQHSQMPEAFRAADVFVLPSIATGQWQEQFGMSLIEAMACGVPIISTLSGAIPEVAGDSTVLVQPNDFLALYESLKGLVLDVAKREKLGKAACEHARKHFTLRDFAERLSDLYENLLRA